MEQAERQETTDSLREPTKLEKLSAKKKQKGESREHKPHNKKFKGNDKKPHTSGYQQKTCLIHGTCAHDTNECTLMKDQADKMKATYQAQGNRNDKNRFKKAYENNQAEQITKVLQGLMKTSSTNKRKTPDTPAGEINTVSEYIKNNFAISDENDADSDDSNDD
jgi:hypothetical protein